MIGQMIRIGCCFLLGWLAANRAGAQEPVAGNNKMQRYALLIGVDDYAPPLGKLRYCHNDMVSMQAHLKAAGFAAEDIIYMHEDAEQQIRRPTKANIEGQLRLRLKMAKPEDLFIVAFSGHGLHLDGKSYLCPVDAKLDSEATMVAINDIYAQLEKCPARQKLLIVDACRNEPFVRGFKSGNLPDDLAVQLQAPPKGVLVLSSCEVGQFSAEDEQLQHGVFMHFLMQGFTGAADLSKNLGNGDGLLSLHELYDFAYARTMRHVAESHNILQQPVMKGEIVGSFNLAMVPDSARLPELNDGGAKSEKPPVSSDNPKVRTPDTLLLGNTYLNDGKYDLAIEAYSAVIQDSTHDVKFLREARKSRGAAYVARGSKDDINRALIDQKAAGLPGTHLTVRAPTADLKVQNTVSGRVRQNQSVLVTLVQGDWLWVAAVDGSDTVKGYLPTSAVLAQPAPAPAPAPVVQPPRSSEQQYRGYDQQGSSRSTERGGYRDDPPPLPGQTARWESIEEAREMRKRHEQWKRGR